MLTAKEIQDIKDLQKACEMEGSFQLKLNFDMLENRSADKKEDFFHYEEGKLVGFLGLYNFGKKVEICGMVHPEYRRRGIFSRLFESGLNEVKIQGSTTILLNAPADSHSAKEFLKNIPCTFTVTEYQMKWQETELTENPTVTVRPSTSKEDWEAEVQLDVQCFGFQENETRQYMETIKDSKYDQRLIIEANGQTAGKIRVSEMDGEAWIFGFAIFPNLQGKGIGRKALARVVKMEHQKGFPVFLEVEAKNANALGLYESCGFRSYHSQDYYLYNG